VKWFQTAVRDPLHGFYVADMAGKVVGQVRFRLEEKRATVSISIDPRYRGKGLGERLYREALASFKREHLVEEVVAVVKKRNTQSLGFFSRLGFAIDSYEWIGGQHAVVMMSRLDE
jgi:UDP-2,4-diacetamido-2,4,6-trideoxy-beta-L-altropyranose hydrolase